MMNRNFFDPETRPFNLSHQFRADGSARECQRDRLQHVPAQQTKIAIDVPNPEAEKQPDQAMKRPPEQATMKRIGASDLVTVHDVNALPESRQQVAQFTDVVLPVAVGIEDKRLGRGLESASQSTPVSPVLGMPDDSQGGKLPLHPLHDVWGIVGASIVNDDHLEIRCDGPQSLHGLGDQDTEALRVVVRREEDRDCCL
jgi:hypothetical protein